MKKVTMQDIRNQANKERKWIETPLTNGSVIGGNSHLRAHFNQEDKMLVFRLKSSNGVSKASTFLGDSLEMAMDVYDILKHEVFIDLVSEAIAYNRYGLDRNDAYSIEVFITKEDWEDFIGKEFPKTRQLFWKGHKIVAKNGSEGAKFCFKYNENGRLYLTSVYPNDGR